MMAMFVSIAYAQSALSGTLGVLIENIRSAIFFPFVFFLIALALFLFLFGMAEFLKNASDEEGRSQGKRHMVWGIIGLFIMFSVWGIMRIICDTIGAC